MGWVMLFRVVVILGLLTVPWFFISGDWSEHR